MTEPNVVDQTMLENFLSSFAGIQRTVYDIAEDRGWWSESREDGTLIALMHSELSEMLEAIRNRVEKSDHITEHNAVEEEAADIVIRVMDFCEHKGYDLAGAIIEKMNFNCGREHRHGGKKF